LNKSTPLGYCFLWKVGEGGGQTNAICCYIIGWNAVLTVSLKRNVSLQGRGEEVEGVNVKEIL
jgi:hypothetical protein